MTDNIIKLDTGNYLIKDYGKYRSNLCFINKDFEIPFVNSNHSDWNLPQGSIRVVYGEYFVSKKGTKCFRCTNDIHAKHVLLQDNWGGAFNSYRGGTLPEDKALYYRVARSNGGGTGYDYGVYPNAPFTMSEEDI